MKILKKTYSKNNNEIVLIEQSQSKFDKTVLIIGVVHGDEPQGKFLIENYLRESNPIKQDRLPRFLRNLAKTAECIYLFLRATRSNLCSDSNCDNQKNKLLFIPCLNPDGLELNTRQNANGIDLNRNFPTINWERIEEKDYFGGEAPASEIETKFVIEIIEEFKPDVILTLHAPYKVVNYDGPAKDIAEKISEIINYPATTDIGYPTPGSFGTYSGVERKIPTITLELDEEIEVNGLINPINKIFDYLLQM